MNKNIKLTAFKAAFPYTIPILASFLFLGITYGVYMRISGFSFIYPMIMSIVIFGGSLEFVTTTMLLAPFAPLQAFITAFIIQARHLFYGISMLDRYKGAGLKKIYLVFGLCDETFSINYAINPAKGVDRHWFIFFVTLLNQIYWVSGATIGGLLGSLFTFNTRGLEFTMTALFVVIFLEQFLKEKRPYTGIIGLAAAIVCRLGFGADNFLIPTMLCIVVALTLIKRPMEKSLIVEYEEDEIEEV